MILKVIDISQLALPEGNGKRMPIFYGKTVIRVGIDGIRISVNTTDRDVENATCLLGHEKPISSLSLSPNGSFILCSCSEDRVILWNLFPIKYSHKETPFVNDGLIVGEHIGNVLCCSFSWPLKWLVLCLEKELWIVLLSENIFKTGTEDGFSLHRLLSTDSKLIDMCSFSSQYPDILVTVEDKNHFKIWNVATCELIYRSSTVINNCINCCSYGGMPNKLLIGTKRGVAHVYHVNEKFLPSSYLSLNLGEENFVQHAGRDDDKGCNYQKNDEPMKLDEYLLVKKECIIFSMKLYNRNTFSKEPSICASSDESKLVAEKMFQSIICPGSILFICCSFGVILYDCKSCEPICSLSFTESQMLKMMPNILTSSIEDIVQGGKSLNDCECWIKTHSPNSNLYHINFVVEEPPIPKFESGNISTLNNAHEEIPSDECSLTFLPSVPISKKSPLLYCMKHCSKSSHALAQPDVPRKNDKVKSSGYGTTSRKKMFIPITNESKKPKKLANARKVISLHHAQPCCNEGNVLNYGPPEKLVKNIKMCETNGTPIKLAFSVNGCQIACNSTSTELCILPAKAICMEKSIIIPGHNSSITSLAFNLNSKWLLSSATDSTVKIWNWRNRKCIFKINTGTNLTSKSKHISNPVTQAGFFYLDKFIVVASKDQMHLYSYLLNENSSFPSWLEQGSSHKIKTIDFQTQHVNCFSAANQFHTYLIMAGCSNRNLAVYDLNHQKMARMFKDAHVQHPPHCLVQQTGSVCPSIPALVPEAYNLFLSAAICDGVKLWDLRTPRCIQKYNRHINRMYTFGMDFSPCSRFVAVCSEDKKVYLYDTRNCENHLSHLKGFPDVPTDVSFSPCMTQLAVSSLNGHLFTFAPNAVQLGNGSSCNANKITISH